MQTTTPNVYMNVRELHEQLVQPITYLNAAIELWEQGMQEPEDIERMREEVQKLVEVVRDMQAHLRSQKFALISAIA
jgi:hypothetical protein